MEVLRILIAFFQALLPFFGFGVLGIAIYDDLKSPYNFMASTLVFGIGFLASRFVFNLMRKRGILAAMSGDNATMEIDEVKPVSGDNTLRLSPLHLNHLFLLKKIRFEASMTISIWGDWQGRDLDQKHTITTIDYDHKKEILTINFSNENQLKIRKPGTIYCGTTYLKIPKAKEILWQVPISISTYEQYSYLNTGKTIKTRSNTEWKPHHLDIGIGMNALYLQA